MHRIEGTYYDASGGTNLFQDQSYGGTRVTAAWLNAVQEELCNILTGLGGTVATEGADTSRNLLYTQMETAGIAKPAVYEIDPMSSSTTFTSFYGIQKIFFLNPDGAYNFNPSGSFNDGVIVVVCNTDTGANTVTFDSGDIAEVIAAGTTKKFLYDLTNVKWRLIS